MANPIQAIILHPLTRTSSARPLHQIHLSLLHHGLMDPASNGFLLDLANWLRYAHPSQTPAQWLGLDSHRKASSSRSQSRSSVCVSPQTSCLLARETSSHRSCSDTARMPSHDSRYCLAPPVLLPRRSDSDKIPAKHPSALLLFPSSQVTDRCFFIPSYGTSVHQLTESYWLPSVQQKAPQEKKYR